ncbi:MAG TPA: hypothetical protein VMV47_01045 [Bacteroidales bacterium]|nr:hypothetical protein [Bacteroidales bacterium]
MGRNIFLSFITLLASLFTSASLIAQNEDSFTPNGKPFALIFSDVSSAITKDEYSKSFNITRAYLGYEYFFTRNISSKINIDVADPGIGKLQMTAFIKNAYVQYKKDNLSARFGMIGTSQFSVSEKQWGYRYIYKSFQDAYNFGPSADLGAAFDYSPFRFLSVDLSLLNGEGYKKLQADSTFKATIGLTVTPFKNFVVRGYYDRMNNNYNQSTYSLFAGYTWKTAKVGIEYNYQLNNGMLSENDFSGVSAFTSVALAKKFTLFARYDKLTSTIRSGEPLPWNNNRDGQLFMAGFDYSPAPGIRIAPNYQGWSPYDESMPFTSTIALNFEIKF